MLLRPYQEQGLQALWSYFMNHKGNPCIAWPTGTGKSHLPAEFIKRTLQHYPNQRFLLATHVKELIRQNYEKVIDAWPNAPIGVYSAGLKRRDILPPIVYGGVKSMYKIAHAFGHRDILWIDEAHLLNPNEDSMYQILIKGLKEVNPKLKIIGMSATPYRVGQGMITDGGLFTHIAHDLTGLENFNTLVKDGYLSPLIPKKTQIELNVDNVGIQGGEFIQSQLQHEVDKAEITWKGLQELCYYGQTRRSWLLFATGIEHANHISEMLNQLGIQCASVHSKQPTEFNDSAIQAFKNYSLRAIVNYGKLTTGFDHPGIDLIGMFRPTLSVSLWVQMLGRGTRPCEGKDNCIAEGSLVLTQNGLIPIEKITLSDKVWDGENFVSHSGMIYKGYKEVIEYEGLSATPEHRVYTEKGWQTFRECFDKKFRIAITGINETTIRKTEDLFTGNYKKEKILFKHNLYYLPKYLFQIIYKLGFWKSWLSQMWTTSSNSKMAFASLYICSDALQQSERQTISRLRKKRNKIQFQNPNRNGGMDNEQFGVTQGARNRSRKQQWSLRNWQHSMGYQNSKYEQPQIIKKHVYDIANAGRHNRFTVNGLLVHNCLVLDFAKNTIRLGPINDPVIPNKKGNKTGDLPVKICDACGVYNHISARKCDACGAPFEFEVKITKTAGTEELIKNPEALQIEYFDVTHAVYKKRQKIDKPEYIEATYFAGMNSFKEFIFPQSKNRSFYFNWWRQRHISEPPATATEALRFTNELRRPKRIRVHVNRMIKGRNLPEILGVEW